MRLTFKKGLKKLGRQVSSVSFILESLAKICYYMEPKDIGKQLWQFPIEEGGHYPWKTIKKEAQCSDISKQLVGNHNVIIAFRAYFVWYCVSVSCDSFVLLQLMQFPLVVLLPFFPLHIQHMHICNHQGCSCINMQDEFGKWRREVIDKDWIFFVKIIHFYYVAISSYNITNS